MPRLSEIARHLIIPEGIVTSVYPRVRRRLLDVGVTFDDWQQGFSQVALGCRESGRYAASVGGVVASWPRQIGKTFTVGNLMIGLCLEFPGTRVIWTSHHNRTTTNTFRAMQSMVRAKKIWPHVGAIRTANGEQEIVFTNGSIIMFGAREQGFGRGMDKIDFEVFDEAQILGLKALEDMVPATNAAKHVHGGLVIFIGTPPRPGDDGEAFTVKRQKALAGKTKDQVYCEISADPETDPDDQSKYHTFNPSFPHRTPMDAMLRMRENIPDEDSWRREAMGIWDELDSGLSVVDTAKWPTLADAGPEGPATAFGVASHNGQFSVVAAWVDGDDVHVEEVFAHFRLDIVADWLFEHVGRRRVVMVDNSGQASALVPMLKAKRMKAMPASVLDMSRGCEVLWSRVKAGTLTHSGDRVLTTSVVGARRKPYRDKGAWIFELQTELTISPAMALALALIAASAKKPKRTTTREAVVL